MHIRSAMSISIKLDRMVGSQRVWRFMVIIQRLLPFTMTPSFQVTFGMDLIIATVFLLRIDGLARDHSYLWCFGLFSVHSYKYVLAKFLIPILEKIVECDSNYDSMKYTPIFRDGSRNSDRGKLDFVGEFYRQMLKTIMSSPVFDFKSIITHEKYISIVQYLFKKK